MSELSTINLEPKTLDEAIQTIAGLAKIIVALQEENARLKEQLNTNSNNSSQPPSHDIKGKRKQKAPTKKPGTGRRRGGQPGHKGVTRELLPSHEVDVIARCELPSHCNCGGEIVKRAEVYRVQVHELPEIKVQVTEYQCEKGRCNHCRKRYTAEVPAIAKQGIIGPRLMSLMSLLTSKYHLSRALEWDLLKEVFNFKISMATICNKEKRITTMTTPVCDEVLKVVKSGEYLHADETSMRESGKNGWLWTFSNAGATYFATKNSRGRKVLRDLLGECQSTIISDRYSAYTIFADDQRQLCWAHLTRDFRRLSESAIDNIARIGKELLAEKDKLFEQWYTFKEKQITRECLQRNCEPIARAIENKLTAISYTEPTLKAAGTCKNILKHNEALWTFIREEGIEPTNNHAEQQIRPAVIWRKISFGSQSPLGSQFIAHLSTVIATAKKQSINVWDFLQRIILATMNQQHIPSLVSINP